MGIFNKKYIINLNTSGSNDVKQTAVLNIMNENTALMDENKALLEHAKDIKKELQAELPRHERWRQITGSVQREIEPVNFLKALTDALCMYEDFRYDFGWVRSFKPYPMRKTALYKKTFNQEAKHLCFVNNELQDYVSEVSGEAIRTFWEEDEALEKHLKAVRSWEPAIFAVREWEYGDPSHATLTCINGMIASFDELEQFIAVEHGGALDKYGTYIEQSVIELKRRKYGKT